MGSKRSIHATTEVSATSENENEERAMTEILSAVGTIDPSIRYCIDNADNMVIGRQLLH